MVAQDLVDHAFRKTVFRQELLATAFADAVQSVAGPGPDIAPFINLQRPHIIVTESVGGGDPVDDGVRVGREHRDAGAFAPQPDGMVAHLANDAHAVGGDGVHRLVDDPHRAIALNDVQVGFAPDPQPLL